jgi:HSP20 family protein
VVEMYWDMFDEIERMHEEMDKIFERMMGTTVNRPMLGYSKNRALSPVNANIKPPICHVQETESMVIASFELPGVDKSDINLNVDNNMLDVKVESKKEKKEESKDKKAYAYSMQSQSYYRRVPLPKEVVAEKAEAEYKNGILRVEIPKKHKDSLEHKRIPIR